MDERKRTQRHAPYFEDSCNFDAECVCQGHALWKAMLFLIVTVGDIGSLCPDQRSFTRLLGRTYSTWKNRHFGASSNKPALRKWVWNILIHIHTQTVFSQWTQFGNGGVGTKLKTCHRVDWCHSRPTLALRCNRCHGYGLLLAHRLIWLDFLPPRQSIQSMTAQLPKSKSCCNDILSGMVFISAAPEVRYLLFLNMRGLARSCWWEHWTARIIACGFEGTLAWKIDQDSQSWVCRPCSSERTGCHRLSGCCQL